MADAEASTVATGNIVDGFSMRFNTLMDRAGVPAKKRLSIGGRRFGVVANTFKSWCDLDRIPGSHADLLNVVENLLKDIPGRYNTKAVVAWLLAGDAVPHPFERDATELALVEMGLQIAQLAQASGIDFQSLPRDVRSLIIRRAREQLANQQQGSAGVTLDSATSAMVVGMLETARAMS